MVASTMAMECTLRVHFRQSEALYSWYFVGLRVVAQSWRMYRYSRADGMKYEGQFADGQVRGLGLLTFADGKLLWE